MTRAPVPPVSNSMAMVDNKKEMLLVRGVAGAGWRLTRRRCWATLRLHRRCWTPRRTSRRRRYVPRTVCVSHARQVDHPDDLNYKSLHAALRTLDRKSTEFQVLDTYLKQTMSPHQQLELLDIWGVDRENEAARFAAHDAIVNRKLLWWVCSRVVCSTQHGRHGTNVAVVAAILKSGLRIMPHSGGRVGKGIYLASENAKSAGYGPARASRASADLPQCARRPRASRASASCSWSRRRWARNTTSARTTTRSRRRPRASTPSSPRCAARRRCAV